VEYGTPCVGIVTGVCEQGFDGGLLEQQCLQAFVRILCLFTHVSGGSRPDAAEYSAAAFRFAGEAFSEPFSPSSRRS
jgi:hypothetical protein